MADSKAADSSQGSGDGDKSQSDGGNANTGDKDVVPKSQFIAAINSANEKYRALEQKVEAMEKAGQKKAEPPEPTRAELLEHVEKGDITQAQADAIWEKQVIQKAGTAAAIATQNETQRAEAERKVTDRLLQYKELLPDVWVAGSDAQLAAQKEYREMVALGSPANMTTELAAIRVAFGSLETLRASKSSQSNSSESHVETGGGKPPGDSSNKDGPPKGLDARKVSYYQKQIDSGRYKGWPEVNEELKFATKR